jgi:formylglycine-generating enzyme required for sulfatase activity
MVFIPAGEFEMGDVHDTGEDHERPPHRVFVRAFHLAKTEVTLQLWEEVVRWALVHGYAFGGDDQGPPTSRAANHPICNVSWYDAVKWANACSERAGLTPVYFTDASHREVYRKGQLDLNHDAVKWTANGYRLPTEAEWEKAARGGLSRQHFPWASEGGSFTNHIDGRRANYMHSGDPFETETGLGTTPVAYFDGSQVPPGLNTANGYGLYDVAGNVAEWCWDWYDGQWYASPQATARDSRGPEVGRARILRGGSWINDRKFCRVAARYVSSPGYRCCCYGLRLALNGP